MDHSLLIKDICFRLPNPITFLALLLLLSTVSFKNILQNFVSMHISTIHQPLPLKTIKYKLKSRRQSFLMSHYREIKIS